MYFVLIASLFLICWSCAKKGVQKSVLSARKMLWMFVGQTIFGVGKRILHSCKTLNYGITNIVDIQDTKKFIISLGHWVHHSQQQLMKIIIDLCWTTDQLNQVYWYVSVPKSVPSYHTHTVFQAQPTLDSIPLAMINSLFVVNGQG
jgi:hypothetical protein